MIVTVLLVEAIAPGSTNCLQVIDAIHTIKSATSVLGLRFSFKRLPAGNLRHDVTAPSSGAATPGLGAITSSATTNAAVFHMPLQGARIAPTRRRRRSAAIRARARRRLPIRHAGATPRVQSSAGET